MVFDARAWALTRRDCLRQLSVAGAASGWLAPSAWANTLQLGQAAPELVLTMLDGSTVALSSLRGQVVFMAFWASWCEPCLDELALLSAFAQSRSGRGLTIWGINLDSPESLPKVRQIAAGLKFPVGLLGSAWAGGYGRIWRLPVSFVVDRAGRLVRNGWDDQHSTWSTERLQEVLDPLLG